MNPPPPFGDPTGIQRENASVIGRGIATGCGGCLAVMALGFTLLVGILVTVFLILRSLDPCDDALRAAQASTVLREEIGTPMTKGWFVNGTVRTYHDTGTAKISVPVSGPKGAATVQAEATLREGHWIYSHMSATLAEGGPPIDLLPLLPAQNR